MAQSSQPETTGKNGKGRVNFRPFLPPALILIFALALRLWGITWSLPNEHHLLTYHPDEGVNLISGVMEGGVARPHLDLNFYNYGGLYFYLWQGAVAINSSYGFVQQPEHFQANTPPSLSMGAMLLTGRLLTAVLGALTAWAIWALGKRLFGNRIGVAAGILYAIIPAAVVHGHYATVDVPATFFVAVALVYAARLLEHSEQETKKSRMKTLALAGLFSGLAAATKYNCGLVIFAPLAAVFLNSKKMPQTEDAAQRHPGRVPSLSIILAATVTGFIVGCPGILVNPSTFWEHFSFELAKSREGMGILFAGTGNGWIYHFTSSMRFGLGIPLQLLALGAIVYAFARRTNKDWLLLAFFVPYYLLIGWAQVRFLRYIIPILPVIAILVARLIFEPQNARPIVGRALAGVGVVVGVVTLLMSLAMDRMMTLTPVQDQAYAYIQSSVPKGSGIAFVTAPWYYMPPLSPYFTIPAVGKKHAQFAREVTEYQLHPPDGEEWDPSVLQPMLPDYFVVSDLESEDAQRIKLPAAQPFFKLFAESYQPTVFENQPSIFGINFGKRDYLPNDWLYPYPRITIYKRK